MARQIFGEHQLTLTLTLTMYDVYDIAHLSLFRGDQCNPSQFLHLLWEDMLAISCIKERRKAMTTHNGHLLWVAGRIWTRFQSSRQEDRHPPGVLDVYTFVRMTELTGSPVVLIADTPTQTCTDLDLVRLYRKKIKQGGTWQHRLGLVYDAELLNKFGVPKPILFEFPVLSWGMGYGIQESWEDLINEYFDIFLKTCRSLSNIKEMALTIIVKCGARVSQSCGRCDRV